MKSGGGGDYHAKGVDGVAQNALDWANDHVLEFVETDGVLTSSEVRWPQEDVNCLDRGSDALFEVVDGEEVDIKNRRRRKRSVASARDAPTCRRRQC